MTANGGASADWEIHPASPSSVFPSPLPTLHPIFSASQSRASCHCTWTEVRMKSNSARHSFWILLAVAAAGPLTWPTPAMAQIVAGRAKAVQANLPRAIAVLVDTGSLSGTDALQASAVAGSIASLLSADTLHATAIGDPSQVDAEASLGGLGVLVAGNAISADFVMARARKITGIPGTGAAEV